MNQAAKLSIFASVSLARAMPEIASLFERRTGIGTETRFGPSGTLKGDIEGNYPCDIFCSADEATPRTLVRALMALDTFTYAANSLIVVTRNESRFRHADWLDILCDPSNTIGTSTPVTSPEGDRTQDLFKLIARHAPHKVGSRVVAQHSVALINGKRAAEAQKGESGASFMLRHGVDAAVVMASESKAVGAEGLVAHAIPREVMPPFAMAGCHPRNGRSPAAARKEFEKYLLSGEAQEILARHGFLPPGAVG